MFRPLTNADVKEIVKLQLLSVCKLLKESDIWLSATEEALNWLSRVGYDPQFGARPVKRLIQKSVLNELSKQILANKIPKMTDLVLDVFEDKFVFRKPIESDHIMQ
jgi:ATP-dependent Clp protease ATP-binding subunit ClpB